VSIKGPDAAPIRIGELARRAGVTSRAVRHYHTAGLLPEPARDASGHRSYGQADLDALLHIGRLRAEGRTLDEIGAALGADSTRRPR
jgi:DNA-binding transcriptional MerR regulator